MIKFFFTILAFLPIPTCAFFYYFNRSFFSTGFWPYVFVIAVVVTVLMVLMSRLDYKSFLNPEYNEEPVDEIAKPTVSKARGLYISKERPVTRLTADEMEFLELHKLVDEKEKELKVKEVLDKNMTFGARYDKSSGPFK